MVVAARRVLWVFLLFPTWAVPCGADAPGPFAERVDRLVRERQPTADEKRFDEIGWTREIRTAMRLAKEHQRPTFLFTHDGHMAIGRC
jgi:hypothetical protein